MDNAQFGEAMLKLEKISAQLDTVIQNMPKPDTMRKNIVNWIAVGVTILGIVSIIDIIKTWLG